MAYRKCERLGVLGTAIMLLIAIKCLAQEPLQDHSCTVDAAGIFSTPEGQDRQNFNHGGWGFQAGGGFEITRQAEPNHGHKWFITANYLYDKFRARSAAVGEAITEEPTQLKDAKSAHGDFSAVTLDPTIRFALPRHASLYFGGGFGWLHRGIGFNGANLGPALLPSASSLDRVASNSGVFDLGTGVNFTPRVLHGFMVFTEGRVYHGTAINSGST